MSVVVCLLCLKANTGWGYERNILMSNHAYPVRVETEICMISEKHWDIRAVDNHIVKRERIRSNELPNLELELVADDDTAAHVRFRVDLKNHEFGLNKNLWPFNFEEKVLKFASHVAETLGLKMPHVNATASKTNRTAIKNLMFGLFDPWSNGHNLMSPAPSVSILKTRRPTTKFQAWNYREAPYPWFKDKAIYGVCGHFRLGTQIGFFVIDALVGTIRDGNRPDSDVSINDMHRLLEEHRLHILRCWPFAQQMGLEMELAKRPCTNLLELNDYAAEVFYHAALANGELEKVVDRNAPAREGWIAGPKERWQNMTVHAIMRYFMHDGLEVPRFLALLARENVPYTTTLEVDVMGNDSVGIFLKGRHDPLMTLTRPSRAPEIDNV
jgi:hypothetical protein